MSVLPDLARKLRQDGPGQWSVDDALALRGEINPATGRYWTNGAIADLVGISKQAVGKRLNEATGGLSKGGSVALNRALPWELKDEHRETWFGRALQEYHSQQRGEALGAVAKSRVEKFMAGIKAMGDMVVFYDPNDHRGFTIRPRRAGDPQGLCVTER